MILFFFYFFLKFSFQYHSYFVFYSNCFSSCSTLSTLRHQLNWIELNWTRFWFYVSWLFFFLFISSFIFTIYQHNICLYVSNQPNEYVAAVVVVVIIVVVVVVLSLTFVLLIDDIMNHTHKLIYFKIKKEERKKIHHLWTHQRQHPQLSCHYE